MPILLHRIILFPVFVTCFYTRPHSSSPNFHPSIQSQNLGIYTRQHSWLKNKIQRFGNASTSRQHTYHRLGYVMKFKTADTVKPVLRDHCHERPPALKDIPGRRFYMQCNWTRHQRRLPVLRDHICIHLYGRWGRLSIQVPLYYNLSPSLARLTIALLLSLYL